MGITVYACPPRVPSRPAPVVSCMYVPEAPARPYVAPTHPARPGAGATLAFEGPVVLGVRLAAGGVARHVVGGGW